MSHLYKEKALQSLKFEHSYFHHVAITSRQRERERKLSYTTHQMPRLKNVYTCSYTRTHSSLRTVGYNYLLYFWGTCTEQRLCCHYKEQFYSHQTSDVSFLCVWKENSDSRMYSELPDIQNHGKPCNHVPMDIAKLSMGRSLEISDIVHVQATQVQFCTDLTEVDCIHQLYIGSYPYSCQH